MDIFAVEAYTASWIEIPIVVHINILPITSKPIRLRGLKYTSENILRIYPQVEAYTASWIEIPVMGLQIRCLYVEAYTASWIEMKHLEM